jgi:HSP20 family molecular chaperone IbpA
VCSKRTWTSRCTMGMTLPQGVDESRISARFDGGVLEVRVAGAAAVQEPRRIEIEAGDEDSGEGTPGS